MHKFLAITKSHVLPNNFISFRGMIYFKFFSDIISSFCPFTNTSRKHYILKKIFYSNKNFSNKMRGKKIIKSIFHYDIFKYNKICPTTVLIRIHFQIFFDFLDFLTIYRHSFFNII